MSYPYSRAINFPFIVFISAVTAIGGFLFGYDTAVISGAIGFLKTHFELTDLQIHWAGASAIVGCIPGALIAGFLTDRFGRKRTLLLCALLLAISGIFSTIPRTFTEFIIAQTFPILNNRLGGAMTFMIYGVCSFLSLIFVFFALPETKGRTLEEIQASWDRIS